MDRKQFETFRSAVQWVADERRRTQTGEPPSRVKHRQDSWGKGRITQEFITAAWDSRYRYVPNEGVMQVQVVCPTAACLAGNIVLVHGDRFVVSEEVASVAQMNGKEKVTTVTCLDAETGKITFISERATELVGITELEANRLFDEDNSRSRVIKLATQIASKYGHELDIV